LPGSADSGTGTEDSGVERTAARTFRTGLIAGAFDMAAAAGVEPGRYSSPSEMVVSSKEGGKGMSARFSFFSGVLRGRPRRGAALPAVVFRG